MRVVTALLATALTLGGVTFALLPPPETAACLSPPSDFERDVKAAAFVALVEAIDVGGAANEQPRLATPTSSPTYAPSATDAPVSTATRTPRGGKTATATPTLTQEAQFPPPTPVSLAGLGATLQVVTLYAGDVSSPIAIDASGRQSFGKYLREQEALIPNNSSCAGGRPVTYAQGTRYVVFGRGGGHDFATDMRLDVDGDEALISAGQIVVREGLYHRYFEGLSAQFQHGYASLDPGRVPLETLGGAVAGIRSSVIAPPDTGSAGLASGRW